MYRLSIKIFTIFIVLFTCSYACETPVFRYSMEKWASDDYPVKLVYSGEKSKEIEEITGYLQKLAKKTSNTNISFKVEKNEKVSKPTLELFYPVRSNMKTPIWTAPATLENAKAIVNSPARDKVKSLLYKGTPCVFAFFKSGIKEKDEAAKAVLDSQLEIIARKYSIPQLKDENGKYKLKLFQYVEIEPKDKKEAVLKAMAFNLEKEGLPKNEPILLPIFGQGRTLYLIVGKGINRDVLEKDCDFIMGKCSCIVKEQNPGADLLFQADWLDYIGSTWIEEEVPDMSGVGDFIQIEELPPLE